MPDHFNSGGAGMKPVTSPGPVAPAGGNKLEAKGSFNVKSGTKVTAVVTLAGKEAKTVRVFVP